MKKLIVVFLLFTVPAQGAYIQMRMPPGTILPFAGATCPTYTIPANGASLLRAGTYANLFAAISTSWGTADGTHFNAPNFIGRYLKGAGTISDGQGGDAIALAAFQGSANLSHDHTATSGNNSADHNHTIPGRGDNGSTYSEVAAGNNTGSSGTITTSGASAVHTHAITVAARGGTETRPNSYGVTFCVWY